MRFLITITFLFATAAVAQTSCTPSSPCVQVQLSNPNAIPSATILWSCMGATSSCTPAALQAAIAQQTPTNLCPQIAGEVWQCKQFSQTKTPQFYNDPEPWGSLMNYSTQGTANGGVSASSPILIFQVPAAPAQPPSIGSVPTMVTTGGAGPQ